MRAKHVFVAGASGGGKTTFARETHAKHDGISVWVNFNDESGLDGRSMANAVTCRSRAGLDDAVRSCSSPAQVRNLRVNFVTDDPVEAAETVREFAVSVADHFDAEVCVQVILDECQHVLPDESSSSVQQGNPVAWMLHEGRSYNIKAVLMTQDPVEVYYPPIKNCKHLVWVGETKTFHRGFTNYWNLNDLDLPTEDFEFVVIKPTDPPQVVHRGETKEAFA